MEKERYLVQNIYRKTGKKKITVEVPGSKSITNRALLLAALADGQCVLEGALFSDDSRHFLSCIQELGIETLVDEKERCITVFGQGGRIPKRKASLYVGSAGTAARFLTALLGVSEGTYALDASEQMRKRPMAPLLSSLEELGCEISYKGEAGCFPFVLKSRGVSKNQISIDIQHSSQFLSALLIASVCVPDGIRIQVEGTHGMSYIVMTVRMMEQFGVRAAQMQDDVYAVQGGQHYHMPQYRIEPDLSAACYFYAMAAVLGIEVTVKNVRFSSMQGDIRFLTTLEKMGCEITETEEGLGIRGPEDGKLKGVTVDMSAFSDQAITLAAIAPYADSPTTICGIGHIRYQESNRIEAIVTELTKLGVRCTQTDDSITIYPSKPHGGIVKTYDDHRMAMGFSLLGLRTDGIEIDDPMCCRKTFEEYFSVLSDIINRLQERL